MERIEIALIQMCAGKNITKNTLKERIKSLISCLEVELNKLNDENYQPSKNGIIQGAASEIDVLSVKLSMYVEMENIINKQLADL